MNSELHEDTGLSSLSCVIRTYTLSLEPAIAIELLLKRVLMQDQMRHCKLQHPS
jgi:hypothetical protein